MSIHIQLVSEIWVSILLYVVLCSLLCARVTFTDALNFNPCNNFLSKPVLLVSSSDWLYSLLLFDLYFLSVANNNFHLVFLNAQGIRDFQERNSIFTEIKKQKPMLPFYKKPTVPLKVKLHVSFNIEVKCLFAYVTNHSRSVIILFSD